MYQGCNHPFSGQRCVCWHCMAVSTINIQSRACLASMTIAWPPICIAQLQVHASIQTIATPNAWVEPSQLSIVLRVQSPVCGQEEADVSCIVLNALLWRGGGWGQRQTVQTAPLQLPEWHICSSYLIHCISLFWGRRANTCPTLLWLDQKLVPSCFARLFKSKFWNYRFPLIERESQFKVRKSRYPQE